jgi:hypothetical protein
MICHEIYLGHNISCIFGFHLNLNNIQNKFMKCMYIKNCGNKALKPCKFLHKKLHNIKAQNQKQQMYI